MKKIMILGAGIYQVPLINAAKRLGLYTIVVSIPGKYPGFELADKVYYENTVDTETILKIAKEESIDGIVTAGTDVAVKTIGVVCDAMGLRGLSEVGADIAANKFLMKTKYEEMGVSTARFRQISFDDDSYEEKLVELNFPLIFKSVDSSGSRGIMRVDSKEDFSRARENVKENTRSDYFIVEEFIDGEEFGAQAFVQDGKLEFILPHGDYVFKGDTGVPIGHYAPIDVTEDLVKQTEEELAKAIKAMELDNCAINADFIMKDGRVYVLELGGRSGATCLAELTSIYYGFDYYEKILQVALGEKVDFSSDMSVPNASMLLMADKDGVIKSQNNGNPADEDIVEVGFDYEVGDEVKEFHVGPDRIGHVITKGDTLDAAVDKLNFALDNIDIVIE